MKFCSNCGEKLVDNQCPNCSLKKEKQFFSLKKVLIILLFLGTVVFIFFNYKRNVENEFILNYVNLYSDSAETVPQENLSENKLDEIEKQIWAVSGDKSELKQELVIVREKVVVRDKLNELFNEPIPSNFDVSNLTIKSEKRMDVPIINEQDTFYKGISDVINYYNSQFDDFESVKEIINNWDVSIVSFDDIYYLESYIEMINDQKLRDEAERLSQDILSIKTNFEDYFNEHVGFHFNISDNKVYNTYYFDYPNNELSYGMFQGDGAEGNFQLIKYDMQSQTYFIYTSLNSMDMTIFDGTITPVTLIDRDTISVNNNIAVYDPEEIEMYNYFQDKPSVTIDKMEKLSFDTSVIQIHNRDDATMYFSKFKDTLNIPELILYELLDEQDDFYQYNIRVNSEGSAIVTNRIGTVTIYKNGYITYETT